MELPGASQPLDESAMVLSLKQVAERIDSRNIPWALFAGAAAAVYGSSRPTTDIDILVAAADLMRVAELFPEADVRCCVGEHMGVFLPGFDIIGGLPLMDLDGPMTARLTHHNVGGHRVPVIPAEDNILIKAVWGRGATEGKHDWEDVAAMVTHQQPLDWDYLEWRVSSLPRTIDRERVLARLRELDTCLAHSEPASPENILRKSKGPTNRTQRSHQ